MHSLLFLTFESLRHRRPRAIRIISFSGVLPEKITANMLTPVGANYLSLPQIQSTFGVSRSFIYQLRRQRKLSFHYILSKPFVRVSDFESLMQPEGKEVANG